VICQISPHEKFFKFFKNIEQLGVNGIQLAIDKKD
jgi:hypothetical protein